MGAHLSMSDAAKKYVAVHYDAPTCEKLRTWAETDGLNLRTRYDGMAQDPADFAFHTTIFCTTTEHRLPNEELAITGSARVVGLRLLGTGKNIPALELESRALKLLRRHFARTHGMKDAWPEYCPHVTVSYAKESVADVSKVPLPDFELVIARLSITDAQDTTASLL
jgi:hypothetical protein